MITSCVDFPRGKNNNQKETKNNSLLFDDSGGILSEKRKQYSKIEFIKYKGITYMYL